MKVVAITAGYDGVAVRRLHDEFEMPDGSTGTWFKPAPVEPPPVEPPVETPAPPRSLLSRLLSKWRRPPKDG